MDFSQELIRVPDFGKSIQTFMQWTETNQEVLRQYCHPPARISDVIEEILVDGILGLDPPICSWIELCHLKMAARVYDLIKLQADAGTLSLDTSDICVIYYISNRPESYTYILGLVVRFMTD